jgi:hypothetical protein
MATLTPEQWRQLMSAQQAQGNGNPSYLDEASGLTYMGLNNSGAPDWLEAMSPGGTGGYGVGQYAPGAEYSIYNAEGQDTGASGNYSEKNFTKDLMLAAMMMGGVYGLGSLAQGAGWGAAGGGATGGGFDAAAAAGDAFLPGAAAGDAYLPGALNIGGNIGVNAPLAGLDAYLVPGAASAAGGAAGGAAGAAGSGAATTAGGGLLSSLGGKGLGLAATALGGLAGAQGQDNTQTAERKMDPRLDDAVYGAGGLVPRTQGLLASQMSPERMAEWRKMQTVGQGLLGQPVAGNGFNRFYPG